MLLIEYIDPDLNGNPFEQKEKWHCCYYRGHKNMDWGQVHEHR